MRGGTARFEREGHWSGGRLYAACKRWQGKESELVHARPQHSLVLTLSGSTSLTGNKISSLPMYEGADRAGSLSFVPGGAERRGWYRDADMQFIALLIEPGFSAAFGIETGELPAFTNRYDALLEALLRDLANEMHEAGGAVPSLYVEHVANLAMLHLARMRRARSSAPRRPGKLSKAELARVLEFVEARLDAPLSLTELGALTGMRPDLFARRFKAQMKMPPYRYVLERRIERARALLAHGRTPIAEVAFALGFSSQSHFTRAFVRHTGVTPAEWRRRSA